MDQPGKVANPARGKLNRENNVPLSPCVPENLVSRDEFSRPVPRQPAHLHTQAESGAYLRDSSRVPLHYSSYCIVVMFYGTYYRILLLIWNWYCTVLYYTLTNYKQREHWMQGLTCILLLLYCTVLYCPL